MKGTKMLNPMYSIATDGTIAYAEQIKDESRNKFQKDINDEQAATNAELQAAIDNIPKGIPTLTFPDSTASQVLAPNTLYIFAIRTSTLTLTLGTPIEGIANEYHFIVECGSTAPTINFPSGIAWNGENAPEIAADKKYEISILNNIAAFFEV